MFAFMMTNMSIFSSYWVSGTQHVFDSSHGTKRELAEHYGLRMYYGELSSAKHHGTSLNAESVSLKIGSATKDFFDLHFDQTDIEYGYIAKAAAVGEFVFVIGIEALVMMLIPFFVTFYPMAFSTMPLEKMLSFAASVVLAIAWITYIVVDPRSACVDDDGFFCSAFGYSLWLLIGGDFSAFFAFLCFRRSDGLKYMCKPKSVPGAYDEENINVTIENWEAQQASLEAAANAVMDPEPSEGNEVADSEDQQYTV